MLKIRLFGANEHSETVGECLAFVCNAEIADYFLSAVLLQAHTFVVALDDEHRCQYTAAKAMECQLRDYNEEEHSNGKYGQTD